MYTPVTLPVTNEYGYFEIRLESMAVSAQTSAEKCSANSVPYIFP